MDQVQVTLSESQSSSRILMLTTPELGVLGALDEAFPNLVYVNAKQELISAINDGQYELLLVDGSLTGTDTIDLVSELGYRFPYMAIVVIIQPDQAALTPAILDAGAADALSIDIGEDYLVGRLGLLLRQHQKNNQLRRYNNRLHSISVHAQALYNTQDLGLLIENVTDIVCTRMGMYGVAITINQGDTQQLYAGSVALEIDQPVYHESVQMEQYHPLFQPIITGTSLIFDEIGVHTHYVAIPIIKDSCAALILPLKSANSILGSIAFFSDDYKFTTDDLVPLELLATHFCGAYQNVRHFYRQEQNIRSKGHLVQAWESLTKAYSINDVLQTLHDLVAQIDSVYSAAVFILEYRNNEEHLLCYSSDSRQVKLIEIMYEQQILFDVMGFFDNTMTAVSFYQSDPEHEFLTDMFAIMDSAQIALVPIARNMLLGGIFIAPADRHGFPIQDLELIENQARATAQTIERNTLIDEIQAQKGRLEAVVRSIHEALFFVNESGIVIFCNPQFTELTEVNPSRVLGEQYTLLLDEISKRTTQPEQMRQQLEEAVSELLDEEADGDEYPIIETRLAELDSSIYIEFMKTKPGDNLSGWLGFIRSFSRITGDGGAASDTKFIANVMESFAIPLFDVHKKALMLPDQYDILSSIRYIQMVKGLNKDLQQLRFTWQNLLKLYRMESTGEAMQMAPVLADQILKEAREAGHFDKINAPIQINAQPPQIEVKLDERQFLLAITNIVEFMSMSISKEQTLYIHVLPESQFVTVSIQDRSGTTDQALDDILAVADETTEVDDSYGYRLGLYVAQDIIAAHGGNLLLESNRALGTVIKAQFPVDGTAEILPAVSETSISRPASAASLTAVILESGSGLLNKLYPVLEFEGYELVIEQDTDNALQNLGMIQIDLMILETDNPTTIVEQTRYIRSKTDVPLLIATLPEAESSSIKALSAGADAYILPPFSREKMIGQMQSVAKRKDIPARVAAPIQVGDLFVDFSRRRVYLGNKLLDLNPKEYDLLRVLVVNRGQVLTHQQILTRIWGPEYRDETQYLWVNISRLRRKLEPTRGSPRYIHTEKGYGYIFREPN